MTRLALTLAFCSLLPARSMADDPDESSQRAALVLAVSARGEADAGGTPLTEVADGTLRRNGRHRMRFQVPADTCVLLVAQGADFPVQLALTIGGRVRARAEGRPAQLVHCHEGAAARGVLEVRARGEGAFAAAAFRVASESALQSPQEAATSHDALEAMVRRHGEGQVPASGVETEGLTDGAQAQKPVHLVGGSCYRVLAAGGPGVRALSLELMAPGGDRVARSAQGRPRATLGVLRPLCPTRTGDYALRIRAEGGGEVAWRTFRAAAAERAAAAAAARHRPPVGGAGTGFVARALRDRHGEVGEGMLPLLPAVEGQLGRSETRTFDFTARSGQCYRVIAVGMPSVRSLRVRFMDAYGSERASSREEPRPSARFCASSGGTYRAELKATNGYGGFALQVFEAR
ncbi:MAG: hypothetical protein CMN30_23630 [Sandaracinus sp.]|nr:hypothetical protein [Sandaracinus sp.]